MSLARQAATILGASGIDPDAARWIAAVGSANVSAPRGRLISNTIRSLKAASVWADIDYLPVLAAQNAASALVDWKARKTMTATNSPTFTADLGYAFDGLTNYIAGGFIPSSDSVAATGTSFMIGAYERTNISTNTNAAGGSSATARQSRFQPRGSTGLFTAGLNAAVVTLASSVTDSRGLSVAATNGTAGVGYKNGVEQLTAALTTPGSSLPNVEIFIGGYNASGSLTAARASSIGYVLFGANAWTATQHLAFYNIMQRYMTALGAQV